MIDITPIINALILLVSAIISVFLIPWLKTKKTIAEQEELLKWINIGVVAMEQIITGTKKGEERRDGVLTFLENIGYKLNNNKVFDMVDIAIEAFVKEMNDDKAITPRPE